jgi:AmmeMemoRadiSam system protein A
MPKTVTLAAPMTSHARTAATAPPALSDEDRRSLLRIARAAMVEELAGTPAPALDRDRPALRTWRAAFVTLTRRDTGALRGCRGEVIARRPLAESVARMAIASAIDDPRFPPVTVDELPAIRITINALTPPVPIRPEAIVVGRHGLWLTVEGQSGLLLPEVPAHYGWDRERFLTALCRKAGVPDDAWRRPDAELRGFEAESWSED